MSPAVKTAVNINGRTFHRVPEVKPHNCAGCAFNIRDMAGCTTSLAAACGPPPLFRDCGARPVIFVPADQAAREYADYLRAIYILEGKSNDDFD